MVDVADQPEAPSRLLQSDFAVAASVPATVR
jgi:hypothetical protein